MLKKLCLATQSQVDDSLIFGERKGADLSKILFAIGRGNGNCFEGLSFSNKMQGKIFSKPLFR